MKWYQKLWSWLWDKFQTFKQNFLTDLEDLKRKLTLNHIGSLIQKHSVSFFLSALLLVVLPGWRGFIATPWTECLGGGTGMIEGWLRFLISFYNPACLTVCGFTFYH